MRPSLFMLGGLLIWGLHFAGSYAIASVFDVVAEADVAASRWSATGFTVLCLVLNAGVLVLGVRRRRVGVDAVESWMIDIGLLGAAFSLIAVLWQGLPALIGH